MKKKIFAIGALVVVMSVMFSMPAFAKQYNFSFSVTPSNDVAYSAANPKDDNEQTAYVHTQSGNIIASDSFWFSVYSVPVSGARVSDYQRVTSNSAVYKIPYNTRVGASQDMYLQADTDMYYVSISGFWFS